MSEEHGAPYIEVPAKRSADKVPVQIDWHDYLANDWQRGVHYAFGVRIRPRRAEATGFEYEVTTAGVSGSKRPVFPKVEGATVQSGSVTFTARAISNASLRATIVDSDFPVVTGLTLTDQSSDDLVHTVYASGGTDGANYEVMNRITLSNAPGELKEAVALLPVRD